MFVPGKAGGKPLQYLHLQNACREELVCGSQEEREQQAWSSDSLWPEGDFVPPSTHLLWLERHAEYSRGAWWGSTQLTPDCSLDHWLCSLLAPPEPEPLNNALPHAQHPPLASRALYPSPVWKERTKLLPGANWLPMVGLVWMSSCFWAPAGWAFLCQHEAKWDVGSICQASSKGIQFPLLSEPCLWFPPTSAQLSWSLQSPTNTGREAHSDVTWIERESKQSPLRYKRDKRPGELKWWWGVEYILEGREV